MPLASVDAVHVTWISVVDCAVAVTPEGTVGGVVSAGGSTGLVGVESSPPPPQADNNTPSDASVAKAIFRSMRVPYLFSGGDDPGGMNLRFA
jgi:hypothetical protein